MRDSKPNIIVIMADQMAAQALGAYGNPVCKTPHIDRLAAAGTVFDAGYCNNPLCAPSRGSMLTGLLTPRAGVFDNANELASSLPTMAHHLRHAGYWTELCGKMHFIGPDQLHGFNERSVTDVYPAGFHWVSDWSAGPGFVPSGTALNGVVESGPCIRTLQEDYDDEVEHRCIQGIYDRAREPERTPFFQVVSFTNPHTPFTVAEEFWARYDPDEIDEPEVGPLPFAELDYHSRALFFAHGRHRHRITGEHLRRARHAYYGMISCLDDRIGRILDTLERTGQKDDTAIFLVSDHGEMLGERGMWFKQCFWEWSVRVPCIAVIPGVRGGARSGRVVSLVDLLPTLLDLAGMADDEVSGFNLDGRSFLPLVGGQDAAWPDVAIADYLGIGPCVPARMVRKGRYKYIYTHGHPDQLYDIETDPHELQDLAALPELAATRTALHATAMDGYDPRQLNDRVLESQRRRRFIARLPGEAPSWDHVARIGDEHRYVRGAGVDATKGRLRLPRVAPVPEDWPPLDAQTISALMRGALDLDEVLGEPARRRADPGGGTHPAG